MTESSNFFAIFLSNEISIILSIPLRPRTTGTPTVTSLYPYSPFKRTDEDTTVFVSFKMASTIKAMARAGA